MKTLALVAPVAAYRPLAMPITLNPRLPPHRPPGYARGTLEKTLFVRQQNGRFICHDAERKAWNN